VCILGLLGSFKLLDSLASAASGKDGTPALYGIQYIIAALGPLITTHGLSDSSALPALHEEAGGEPAFARPFKLEVGSNPWIGNPSISSYVWRTMQWILASQARFLVSVATLRFVHSSSIVLCC